jgi:hypothetical protein
LKAPENKMAIQKDLNLVELQVGAFDSFFESSMNPKKRF